MAEDFYMPSGEEANAAPAEEASETESENTALLPRSFFAGKDLTPGSRCEIEIVHGYEDEVEVKYLPHSEGYDEEKSAMGAAEMEMDGMMEA